MENDIYVLEAKWPHGHSVLDSGSSLGKLANGCKWRMGTGEFAGDSSRSLELGIRYIVSGEATFLSFSY